MLVASKREEEGTREPDKLTVQLEKVLEQQLITTVFQPIVSLTDGEIFGYEALSRSVPGSGLEMPDLLFQTAERCNKVWELDVLCRSKAFMSACELPADKMLFVNVDPNIINDSRFQKGITLEMLERHNINAANIIFEITEKNAVTDYATFRQALDNYTSQGYQIAIDDTGAGYSGLKLVAEVRPQFIKVDMDLVRNIDKDFLKQAMMKALYEFSIVTNMKIIAEGIETVDELETLIYIGVPYGQGYLLQRPARELQELNPLVKHNIIMSNQQKRQEVFHTSLSMPIGEISRQDPGFRENSTCAEVLKYFNNNPAVMGVTILRGDIPAGLVMRPQLLAYLATQYGMAVYMNRPVKLLMNKNFLVVDYDTSLEQVSKLAITRSDDSLYDYIVITRQGQYYGITTVRRLLEKTTYLELNRAKHSNPLSGLPGNMMIERKLQQVLDSSENYWVIYFDLDNFKVYNDRYGFESGDKILFMTAQAIEYEFGRNKIPDGFVGHIGGDDFIAAVQDDRAAERCQAIIDYFDLRIREFYSDEDLKNGYICARNRHGNEEQFPLVSISIAMVRCSSGKFTSVAELAEAASLVKGRCKRVWQSCCCEG